MDSAVSLAMMRKAQLVFESAETFLSFPLIPIAYEKGDFAFLQGGMTPGKLLALREYSQQVDRVPRGAVVEPAGDGALSDVYRDVLESARLARSTRSAAEEADYQAALAVLYRPAPDGTREDTPALAAYKQYRDALYRAQEEYNNRRIDAEYAADPAVKPRWETAEKPGLRQQLEELRQEWTSKGFRAEIEQARAVEDRLGARAPAVVWQGWRSSFIGEIDRLTDASTKQDFVPSAFSPSNIFDAGPWPRFTLRGDAIQALARECPEPLRGRLGDQPDVDIDAMSFEFASVRVERSWFAPGVFQARFWTLSDGAPAVSAGGPSLAGRCPSYVAALVVARNLSVVLRQNSPRNDRALEAMRVDTRLQIGSLRVAPAVSAPGRPLVLAGAAAPARLAVAGPAMADARLTARDGPSPAAFAHLHRATFAAPLARPVTVAAARDHRRPTLVRPPVVVPPPDPAPPAAAPPAAAAAAGETVYILAFICKRLPRCPDPDPALAW
jgi:hypothetical protein